MIAHAPEDYKTGNAYGARPDLELDPRLYPALEQWLFGVDYDFARDGATSTSDVAAAGYSDWGHRAALAPTHDFVLAALMPQERLARGERLFSLDGVDAARQHHTTLSDDVMDTLFGHTIMTVSVGDCIGTL